MIKRNKNSSGFTLIELMIVIAIIGILASISVPQYLRFATKAKTVEAKTMLKTIAELQEAYRAEHDTYTDDLNAIGFQTVGTVYFSQRLIKDPTTDSFTAEVRGNLDKDPDLDIWTINEKLILRHIQAD